MKNNNKKNKGYNNTNSKKINYVTYEHNVNIRRKSLSILDSKLRCTFTNLNTLLEKINNVKELVVFNKYDTRDLRSLKNLDNNALLFSKNMKEENKKASDYLYAYNLSSLDLDNFMNNLEKESKKEQKECIFFENSKNYYLKDNYNKLKKEFDLANTGKNRHDKMMNNSFLKNESKMRDLYNLKLELFLKEHKKKEGDNNYLDIDKKTPNCLRDKDKRINQRYSTIKSRYYDMYQLSKSFEIEEGMREKFILNEEEKKEDENTIKKDEIFTTKNKDIHTHNSMQNIEENLNAINMNNYIEKENMEINEYNNINDKKKRKKPVSAHIIKSNKYNNLLSFNSNSQLNINTKGKRNRVNSGNVYHRNNYVISPNYNKNLQNTYINRNIKNRPISPHTTTKQTIYSSTISSRPKSAFSSINKTKTIYCLNNNKSTKIINKNINRTSKNRKKTFFTNYINEINKIIKYSNYTTNIFKKSSNKLKNKKLFKKSNSEIFEKTSKLNIDKLRENLNLKKSRNTLIDDKKLIYNNSKKVKLMLTSKNRNILNTILMELIDKQRRVNNFYSDLSHYEKTMQKFERNKKFRKLTNESINFEKRFDRETILEIFKQDEEKIMEYLKEINNKDKYDEEEWKHILLKHKNMRIIDSKNINKMVINGNLHKKHLVSRYKNEKK